MTRQIFFTIFLFIILAMGLAYIGAKLYTTGYDQDASYSALPIVRK